MAINNNFSSSKKRLSIKGLDKIFGEEINQVINEIEHSEDIKKSAIEIDLNLIRSNPYQPRHIFDESEIVQLAQSIVKHGILQPIIVKKSLQGYEVIAGERRTRAAKKAGLKTIPAIILELNDQQMMEISLIENIQRVDLNIIEEAKAYRDLMQKLNLKQGDIALQVGKSRSHIANTMRILNLPLKLQNEVLKGNLTMGQVKPLLSLQDDHKLIMQLSQKIIDEKWNSRKVEEIVKEHQNLENKSKDKKVNVKLFSSNVYKTLEEDLIKKLSTKVSINQQKITIKFLNDKDLNRILEILGLVD